MVSLLHCVYSILYPAGMASLVEFQDFNLNHLTPHHSVMMPTIPEMQTLEEIMAQDVVSVEPLPTPPLSPDHDICCPSPSSESSSHHDHDLDSGDGLEIMAEALINEMISYEQLFAEAMDESGTGVQGSSSFSLEGHFLVQDCMWNSHTYQPRNTIGLGVEGVYTPAPSPTASQVQSAEQNNQEEGEDEEEGEDASTPRNDTSSDSSSTSDQTDCISPNDVFPTCMAMPTLNSDEDEDAAMEEPTTTTNARKKVKVQPVRHTRQERARRAMEREQRSTRGGGERTSSIMTRRASANMNGNSRIQPQASASSESGKWNFNF